MAYRQRAIIEVRLRILNPFTYLGPLTKPEFFFDRKKELDDAYVTCEQILNGGNI